MIDFTVVYNMDVRPISMWCFLSWSPLQVTLSVNHDKLDNEVNSLRYQLETEKSRFRKMQTDLQKELNVVFDENTKLTTLLDGKVPKSRFWIEVFI